ncbi:hypothetical protein LTR37_009976 [Vermiconidia calcicola]|uniref:Uncharacterized protein n=1 Tax=Vermiconidia calcicola TaxID=1690605 RepID=A0ACC3N800_9PEZI|nr:hypothetical protein LTR37_009976 [Vermiconidia calcicola]
MLLFAFLSVLFTMITAAPVAEIGPTIPEPDTFEADTHEALCTDINPALVNAIKKYCVGAGWSAKGPGFFVPEKWTDAGMTSDPEYDNNPHAWTIKVVGDECCTAEDIELGWCEEGSVHFVEEDLCQQRFFEMCSNSNYSTGANRVRFGKVGALDHACEKWIIPSLMENGVFNYFGWDV